MKRILVTGINGFVGRNIIKHFGNKKQYFITGIDLNENFISPKTLFNNFNYSQLDITDFKEVNSFSKDKIFDVIIHLAGILSKEEDPQIHKKMLSVNFESTAILLEIAQKQNSHFIFTSTAMVYGNRQGPFDESMKKNPENFYAMTKSLSEDMILYFNRKFEVDYSIFRPAILYGAGQTGNSFIPSLIKTLRGNQDFQMTKGEQTRDFVYIDDFVDAVKLAVDKRFSGIFNIGTGSGVKIKIIAELVAEKLGLSDKLQIGSLPYRDNEIWNYALSYESLKNTAGWQPQINIEQGIEYLLKNLFSYTKS